MQLICPNSFVIETAIAYAKILRVIFLTNDIGKALNEV